MRRILLISTSLAFLATFSCDSPDEGQAVESSAGVVESAQEQAPEQEPDVQADPNHEEAPDSAPEEGQPKEPDVQDDAPEPEDEQPDAQQPDDPQPDPDIGEKKSADGEPPLTEPIDLPKVTGKCPKMDFGGPLLFRAKGMNKHRLVQIFVDPKAKGKKGPLIFYWHGTLMNPAEALVGLGPIIQKVTSQGGMVVAPFRDIEAGVFPWYLTADILGLRQDDLLLADEVLACAMEQVGIDTRRIHTLGLSAGGLQSTQMSYRRSNYIASSVIYSGGLIIDPPKSAEPRNKFSSMIFHGGPVDIVVLPFALTSERFYQQMKKDGQFGIMCTHFMGHIIPPGVWGSVWKFFQDHPFGAKTPYTDGLPEDFPIYCKFRTKIEQGLLDKGIGLFEKAKGEGILSLDHEI